MKRNPNSLKNLRQPWRPGETGNPSGINRKRPYTDRHYQVAETPQPEPMRLKINRALQAQFGVELLRPGMTFADAQVLRLHINSIIKGSDAVNSLREISDRIEGRSPQRLDLTGIERQEITIRLVEDPPLPPRGSGMESLYQQLVGLAEDSKDEPLMTKAAELALLLKPKLGVKTKTNNQTT